MHMGPGNAEDEERALLFGATFHKDASENTAAYDSEVYIYIIFL